jgi:hypothetical protein
MAQLLSALATGALVRDKNTTWMGYPSIWRVSLKNYAGYPSNSVTLLARDVARVTIFDAPEPDNADANRKNYGSNRYRTSNIRQWLNSDGAAGEWWTAQNLEDGVENTNNADAAPNYRSRPGFLAGFSPLFRKNLLPTTLTVPRNTVTDGGGNDVLSDLVFSPSYSEITAIFQVNADRAAHAMQYDVAPSSQPENYSFRNEATFNSYYIELTTSPSYSYSNAAANYPSAGARPMCNVPNTVYVSDAPDAEGVYDIWWTPPVVESDQGPALGLVEAPFSFGYTVTAGEADDVLTVTEEDVYGRVFRQYTAVSGAAQTFTVGGEDFLRLANGTHMLRVTASNGRGESSSKTWNFQRNETQIRLTLSAPLPADARPERILLSVLRSIRPSASFAVRGRNKGNDPAAYGEDATDAVVKGFPYVFNNNACAANVWGVNFEIKADANDTVGQNYIAGIGGNFD